MAKFLTNIDLSKNQLQNALLHPLATAPSTPSAGQVYFNTGSKKLFLYDGSKWIEIGAIDGAGILTLINGQQGKIDLKNLDLGVFTNTKDGLVPKTGTPSGKFLKDDKTWAALPDTTVEIVDNLTSTSPTKALSAKQGKALKDDLDNRVKTNVPTGAVFTDTKTTVNGKTGAIAKADIVALGIPAQDTVVDISGKADKAYVDDKVKTDVPVGARFTDTVTTVVDSLTNTSATSALSAKQGKALKDDLDNRVKTNVPANAKFTDTVTPVVDNLTSTSATSALSAKQGKVLDDKIGTAETAAKSYADTKAGLAETAANQYTDAEIANLVGSSPEALDTLEELAAALGSDPNFATTVTNQLALKIDKYAANVGGSTSQVITHNLNSRDVIIRLFQNAAPYAEVYCDIERTSVNTVTLKFAKAPTANEYRVVITG